MIDLSDSFDSILVKHAGLHANGIEENHRMLEMAMRMGDEAQTFAYALRIQAHVEKILQVGAWAVSREDT